MCLRSMLLLTDVAHCLFHVCSLLINTKKRSVFAGLDGKRVVKGQPASHIERKLLAKSLKTSRLRT